jgi:hypothetical protein
VVGQPDPRLGQRIEAYLVARGTPAETEEISQFLRRRRHLAGFKVPKAFHWIAEMPTGPTGKLFRRALRVDGWFFRRIPRRHPEVRALARLEGWLQHVILPSFEARQRWLTPQDDGLSLRLWRKIMAATIAENLVETSS